MSVDYHKKSAILQIMSRSIVRLGEHTDGRDQIYHNHQKISSKQIQVKCELLPSIFMSKYNIFNQLFPYLAVNDAGHRVEHFTNIQIKKRRTFMRSYFLYNQFCYLCY